MPQIDKQSGKITALIDLEGTTVAPLWDCAVVPRWILPSKYEESSTAGLPEDLREQMYALFLDVMGLNGEWHLAYFKGRPFRLFVDLLPFQTGVWASKSSEQWVDGRLSWAKMHPGIGFPDDNIVITADAVDHARILNDSQLKGKPTLLQVILSFCCKTCC